MNEHFHIRRDDGRSNQDVIIDYVKDGLPGSIYTYNELIDALNEGSPTVHDRRSLYGIVISSTHRLLEDHQRTLKNIRGTGYQLAHASDHSRLAVERKHRADTQVKRGLDLLRNVRWDELNPNQRTLHESQLLIISGLYEQQQAFDRRLSKIESAIRLTKEIDKEGHG